MAILHVISTGSNTSPYETWAKAATTLAVATAACASGDTIYVDSAHAESDSSSRAYAVAGSQGAVTKILSVTHSGASGADAIVSGASITTSSTTFTIAGTNYWNGFTFVATSSSGVNLNVNTLTNTLCFENCSFQVTGNNTGSSITAGNGSANTYSPLTVFKNCVFRFGNASQLMKLDGYVEFYGGSIHASSTSLTSFMSMGGQNRGTLLRMNGFDFSNFNANFDMFVVGGNLETGRVVNAKLPATWGDGSHGDLYSAVPTSGGKRYELINWAASGSDVNYKFWTVDVQGQCKDDTTIYKDSGAQDEATPYSMKMTTTNTCSWPFPTLRSLPIIQRVAASVGGSPSTVTVDIVHDGASAFTDKEVWLEVEYLATSGTPKSTFVTDAVDLYTGLTTGTAQDTSSATWTGDSGTGANGSSTWNQLKLVKSGLTFAENGYITVRVHMAVQSKTIYVDPKVLVT